MHVPLYDIHRTLLAYKATEPRDKILLFFLGLTDSADTLEKPIDYDKLVSHLLAVAEHIRKKGQLLEVLHFANIGWESKDADVPSWVVN